MRAGDMERTKAAPTKAMAATPAASTSANKRVESLGWLTESAVMPKKHKAIEGVGASSIVELKAQLYRTQEQARVEKAHLQSPEEFHHAKKKVLPHDLFSVKNSGVGSRARKDKLELKAENDGSKSYAVLEKKAELYEKLARGELPDEEEKEKYCVDFFQKSLTTQDEHKQPESLDSQDAQENEDGETDDYMLLNSKPLGPGRTSVIIDNEEHKRFVREVHEEAKQARHMNTTTKLRRQEQEAARREKLKQAYLRKQLEKLISSKKAAAAAPDASADAASSEAFGT